jgi:phosphoribosylformimino-5-aminoimidazole carboxamide ribonucleotide (ProFAR) isomerase
LRVVESSDRAVPSQAIELYRESEQAAKAGMAAWTQLKSAQLAKFNEALKKAGVAAIQVSEIEREGEYQASE